MPARHYVRAEYLTELLRLVPALDVGTDFGAELDALGDHDRMIDGDAFFRALMRAADLSGDPSFGWRFGQALGITKHGFLGYLSRSCRTLRDVLVYDTDYLPTCVTALSLSLHELGTSTRVEIRSAVSFGAGWAVISSLVLGCLARLGEEMLPDGAFAATLETFVVDANERSLTITMPNALLDLPLPQRDPRLEELSARQCARVLAELPAPASAVGSVTDLLEASLDHTLESAAEALAISPRSLRRKLANEGTSFQKLLDEHRERRARHHLRATSLGLEAIATLLGFRGAPSFCQAFKRWTGVSPGQFRSAAARARR